MSNKDSSGFERPWELRSETHHTLKSVDKNVKELVEGTRHKIVANPDYKPHDRELIPDYMAFALCCKDAILHLQNDAVQAMELHLRDLNKWP